MPCINLPVHIDFGDIFLVAVIMLLLVWTMRR
jgi:hypothetical protein